MITRRATNGRIAVLDRRSFAQLLAALAVLQLAVPPMAFGQQVVPFSARVIQSGHSLTDPIVPVLDNMVAAAGLSEARGRAITRSTIPGSPMDWRWNNRNEHMPDARHDIASYDVLVITERVPLSGTVPWHDSGNMALKWFNHAWTEGKGGAGASTILYATWVDTDSGMRAERHDHDPDDRLTFRERLPLEMERWQDIADHVNASRPDGSEPMRVIPGPLIMAAVHDAISAGQAPGLERIEDLFSDSIHLNGHGAYLIGLAHLAVIYEFDPRELSDALPGVDIPAPETAVWMKQLVHDVLGSYPDAGYPFAG